MLYKEFKVSFNFEKYLDSLKVGKFRQALSTFRLSCHNLEIETGRHKGIDREHRKCPLVVTLLKMSIIFNELL